MRSRNRGRLGRAGAAGARAHRKRENGGRARSVNAARGRAAKERPFWKRLLLFLGTVVLTVALASAGLVAAALCRTPAYPVDLDAARQALSSGKPDADGAVEALAAQRNRVWVDLNQVPDNLKNALVATEDKNFYQNDGVDYKRTLAAAANVAFHFSALQQGGSTLTQQLVKNLVGNVNERNANVKLREIVTARKLSRTYSKQEILEMYLNVVTMGPGCYGVQAAARTYFGQDVRQLDLARCAALVSVIPAPNGQYNPRKHPENVRRRTLYVLDNLLEQGKITQAQHKAAAAETVQFLNAG